jgi:hypothetical protein
MPQNEKVDELVTYFQRTYIRGRRLPGRGDRYAAAIFPAEVWNKYEMASEGVARTTNAVEGWHYSLQSLFMCHHPTLWTFLAGLERDCHMSVAAYLQASAGAINVGRKTYRDLKQRVMRVVANYRETEILTYLRAISHLSHS